MLRSNLKIWLTATIFVLGMGCTTFAGKTIYVDANATGANNGSSWADAYKYLQDALAAASSEDEIHVAQGIYKPDQGLGITPGDRGAIFQLKNGVAIKGDYAGFSEPDPNSREIDTYKTILSGDLNGDDIEVGDPCDLLTEPMRADNSCHVVVGYNTNPTAILDGFTISGGNSNECPHADGGGMHNYHGSPTVINCTFRGNSAKESGGGMYNNGSSPTITNCTFTGNLARLGGGIVN